MKHLEKMLGKKEESGMDPMEMDAKKASLMKIKKGLSSKLGEGLKGIKKVSVASDSPEGLEEGLELAKAAAMGGEGEEMEAEELGEGSPDLAMAAEQMTPEEIDEQIMRLMMIKQKKKADPLA